MSETPQSVSGSPPASPPTVPVKDKETETPQTPLPEPTPEEPQLKLTPITTISGPPDHALGFRNAQEQAVPQVLPLGTGGEYPKGLTGTLYTIGPGTYDISYSRQGEFGAVTRTYSFGHWFDHLPLVNRFAFNSEDQSVTYNSRLTAKPLQDKIQMQHGYTSRLSGGLYSTDTNQSIFTKFMGSSKKKAKNPEKEICSGNIVANFPWPGGKDSLVCLSHVAHVQRLDSDSLHPTQLALWEEMDYSFAGSQFCPHVLHDPTTKQTFTFAMDIGYRSTNFHVYAVRTNVADGPITTEIASFPAYPSLVHSFSLTPNYVVVAASPMCSATTGFRFSMNNNLLDSFHFSKADPTLIYVISRKEHRLVVVYQSESMFSFHHINAFEDDTDNIYLDLVAYPDSTLLRQLTLPHLRNTQGPVVLPRPEIRRYLLANVQDEAKRNPHPSYRGTDLPTAHFSTPAKSGVELPRINPLFERRSYRYVYGVGHVAAQPHGLWNALCKVDMLREQDTLYWSEEGCLPGEAVFVPRQDSSLAEAQENSSEDHGYLLSVVFDSVNTKSFLLVLDATSLKEVARYALPHVVPLAFGHGSFSANKPS